DDGDDDLRHGADETLHLEDVEAAALHPGAGLVDGGDVRRGVVGVVFAGVLVAGAAADALVAAGAERPAAVLLRGAVAGDEDDSDVRGPARVVECAVELVDGVRAEGVAHLGAVEGDADDAVPALRAHVAVVGDVGEVLEALDRLPLGGGEGIVCAVAAGHALQLRSSPRAWSLITRARRTSRTVSPPTSWEDRATSTCP